VKTFLYGVYKQQGYCKGIKEKIMGFEIKKKIYHVTILYQAIRGRQIEMRRLGFSCIIRWLSFDDYIIRPVRPTNHIIESSCSIET